MLNYKDNKCKYTLFLFHEAIKEYFKDGGEADKMLANWRAYNKSSSDFPKITKQEIDTIKELKKKDFVKEGDVVFAQMLPVLASCPHMTTDILCLMNNQDQCLVDLKTMTIQKIESEEKQK